MGDETITVGATQGGKDVELPIVDLLTGRGFITGKSGSGKSNSASVVVEKLLDRGYSILAVDIDGEYYGLKEEYEILHVGADEECDLRVGVEHAEKIAELALQQNVPIILDVSSFLDESNARKLLTEVTKQLFAKEKKLKQPFLMLVEEVHEYIPEGGGIDECGRMLIKVSKRGRKHGLGIVGISQRPADVKKDFITQCDWLVWHRLTWNNDTKVVGRILGSEYADEIEEMDDGESFLMTDWNESIRRVQFERKQTFDAGATPGLDDFERPELKSVSGDLVDELQEISDQQSRRENRIDELERDLQRKEERIRDLERQLAEARDLKQMADRFSRAMMDQVTGRPLSAAPGRQSELDETLDGQVRRNPELEAELDAVRTGEKSRTPPQVPDARDGSETGQDGSDENEHSSAPEETNASNERDVDGGTSEERVDEGTGGERVDEGTPDKPTHSSVSEAGTEKAKTPPNTEETKASIDTESDPVDPLVSRLKTEIRELDGVAVEMLEQYRSYGPIDPQECHTSAGGSGDRGEAYATNRTLRQRGLIEHVGCGQYDYALREFVRDELTDPLFPENPPENNAVTDIVDAVEDVFDGNDGAESVDEDKEPNSLVTWPDL